MVSKTPLEDIFADLMNVGLHALCEKGSTEYMLFRTIFFMAMMAPVMAVNRGVAKGASEEEVKEAIAKEMAVFHSDIMKAGAAGFN